LTISKGKGMGHWQQGILHTNEIAMFFRDQYRVVVRPSDTDGHLEWELYRKDPVSEGTYSLGIVWNRLVPDLSLTEDAITLALSEADRRIRELEKKRVIPALDFSYQQVQGGGVPPTEPHPSQVASIFNVCPPPHEIQHTAFPRRVVLINKKNGVAVEVGSLEFLVMYIGKEREISVSGSRDLLTEKQLEDILSSLQQNRVIGVVRDSDLEWKVD
jgi:hypothetical protein